MATLQLYKILRKLLAKNEVFTLNCASCGSKNILLWPEIYFLDTILLNSNSWVSPLYRLNVLLTWVTWVDTGQEHRTSKRGAYWLLACHIHDISMQRRTVFRNWKLSYWQYWLCVILLFCNVLSEEMFHIHSKSAMTS